jgi:hypothetical protein
MFSLQVLGAVAQLERPLIGERTEAGLTAARRCGPVDENPGLRAGGPKAICKIRASRDAAHLAGILALLDSWLPILRRMRPDRPWGDVVRLLSRDNASRRIVERLARLLERAPRQHSDDRLVRLVAGIAAAAPDRTLQQIAAQLEAMREHAARRHVAPLLGQAPAGSRGTPWFGRNRAGKGQPGNQDTTADRDRARREIRRYWQKMEYRGGCFSTADESAAPLRYDV